MHERDLPGRPAEAEQADLQPDPERLAEAGSRCRAPALAPPASLACAHACPCLARRPVVGLGRGVAAPGVERVVDHHAVLELLEVVGVHARQAERHAPAARPPAARGRAARCRRRARSPRAAAAPGRRGRTPSTKASKLQCSPRWVQNRRPSTSKGMAPKRSRDRRAPRPAATNRNSASGSMKRRISHGQAMRSIFGRSRVTQTVRPAASRGGRRSAAPSAVPGVGPGQRSRPRSALGRGAGLAQPGGGALAELQALLADDDRGAAGISALAPWLDRRRAAAGRPEPAAGRRRKSSSARTSISVGQFGVPMRRASLSMEMRRCMTT